MTFLSARKRGLFALLVTYVWATQKNTMSAGSHPYAHTVSDAHAHAHAHTIPDAPAIRVVAASAQVAIATTTAPTSAAAAAATAPSKQFASVIFEICEDPADSSAAQPAADSRKGQWRFVEESVAGVKEAGSSGVGEDDRYDVQDLKRWERACPHNGSSSSNVGRSLRLVCSSNIWTLEPSPDANAVMGTSKASFFTAAERDPASSLAMMSLAKRQVATSLSRAGDGFQNGSELAAATWSLCGQVGALPLQVDVEGDRNRAAVFALNMMVDSGGSGSGSDDRSEGDTRAAQDGWGASAIAEVLDQFRSGKCFLNFVHPDLQVSVRCCFQVLALLALNFPCTESLLWRVRSSTCMLTPLRLVLALVVVSLL